MRLRSNLAAGILNAGWSAMLGLLVVPLYVRLLGLESYGLIGFFAALQGVLALLDMGLSPTMNREVARCRATGEVQEARDLLHSLAYVYWAVALLLAGAMIPVSAPLAAHWLQSSGLSPATVERAVLMMGMVIAVRFPAGLYLGALMGAERQVTASILGIVNSSISQLGAVLVLALVAPTIETFFLWQVVAGVVFAATTGWAAHRALRREGSHGPARFSPHALRRVWRFSAGMGTTTILGTIFQQSDKIVLSRVVPLADFGQYSVAGMFGRVLYVVLTPVFNVIYPRMTALHAAGDEAGLETLYRSGTRLLAAVILPAAAFIALFSRDMLILLLGDPVVAEAIARLVPLVIWGTALNGLMHFPYALQLASGHSQLPALINGLLIVAFVPMLAYLAPTYGIMGGAAAWFLLNLLYVPLGTWLTHRVVLRGTGGKWLMTDVGLPLLISLLIVGGGALLFRPFALNPWASLAAGATLALLAVAATVLASPGIRPAGRKLACG